MSHKCVKNARNTFGGEHLFGRCRKTRSKIAREWQLSQVREAGGGSFYLKIEGGWCEEKMAGKGEGWHRELEGVSSGRGVAVFFLSGAEFPTDKCFGEVVSCPSAPKCSELCNLAVTANCDPNCKSQSHLRQCEPYQSFLCRKLALVAILTAI